MLSPKTTQKTHLHIFTSSKSSSPNTSNSPSSSPNSMKIKTLIHNLCRLIRSLSKLKSLILELCHEARVLYLQDSDSELKRRKKKMNKYRKKILFGSFRLHYNWCSSSHVLPINYNYYSPSSPASRTPEGDDSASGAHMYYDSTWNSVFSTDGNDYKRFDEDGGECVEANNKLGGGGFDGSTQLSSYLEWLEEKGKKKNNEEGGEFEKEMNEIDKLADMFIANCHEKFRLEKIESYRRYQEMLARSV